MSLIPKYSLILLMAIVGLPAYGQVKPVLSQTAPAGTVATPAVIPPAITVSSTSPLYNYVRSIVPMVPVTDAASLTWLSAPGTARVTTEYKDGFNRTMQVTKIRYGTDASGNSLSLVQPVDTRYQQLEQSFLPYTVASNTFRKNGFSEQAGYYNSLYTGEGSTALSRTKDSSTATRRAVSAFLPGKSQTGQNRGLTVKQVSNDASMIRKWTTAAGSSPSSSGYYGINELFGEESTDPSGGRSRSFKDKDGNLVYKALLTEGTTEAITQYVYDKKGRLCYILSPRASELTTTGAVTTTVLDNLCFQYRYDSKGRLLAERKPGEEGFTELVYDRKDRVVMRRSPLEAQQGKWEVSFYDKSNRVIATSLYTSANSQATQQSNIDAIAPGTAFVSSNILHYLATDGGEGVYPGTISGNDMMSYSYYDQYSGAAFFTATGMSFSAASFPEAPATAESILQQLRPQGLLTGTRIRVIKDSGTGSELGDWIETVYYYDRKNRSIQQKIRNATKSGTTAGLEILCSYYDFAGRNLLSSHYHENKKTGHAANEYTRSSYDPVTGRVTETGHKVNNDAWRTLAMYRYDELGRVSRKILGNNAEVQNYSYNIRGQLTGINADYAETGAGGSDASFGESLKYDYGYSSTPRYDGKLSGMIWRGNGTAAKGRSYGYTYDLAGRLVKADFTELSSGAWANTATDYSVQGISYDRNGNIMALKQRGMGLVGSSIVPVNMDSLSYGYENNNISNRLAKVYDTVKTNYNIGDFTNSPTNVVDYDYDPSGNLTKDANKDITAITYTWFNKPHTVTFGNGNTIKYIYDAAGNKLQEKITAGTTTKTTDYVGSFVYQNDTLQYISTAEGRTTYKITDGSYKEEFFVKDHLGNVRSVVEVQDLAIANYMATYEVASAHLEGLVFDKVSEIAEDNPDSPDPGNLQSGLLNGSDPNKRVGTSLLLKVMAGDQVELNVNSYYQGYNPGADAPVNASTMLSSIVGTLTSGAGGLGGSESHNPQLVGTLFNNTNYTQFNSLVSGTTDPSKPKAYLNYILFSQNMQIITSFSGAFQANGLNTWGEIGTVEPLAIPANGYLAVFLTDASTHPVYFDQLSVSFGRGKQLEETHYYPHGLPMGNAGSTAMGFMPNRIKHQSNEYITDAGLNWMDFNARQYDPQIARFLSVDPKAAFGGQEVYSPFAAMGNEPESMIDPNGEAFGSFGSKMNLSSIGSLSGFLMSPTVRQIMEQQAWGVGAVGSDGKTGYDWGKGSTGFVSEYTGAAGREAFYMQVLGEYARGGAARNNIGGGGDPETLPTVTITGKRKGFFGKLWGGLKDGASGAWKWVKGINFDFSMDVDVSYGAQLGADVEIGGREIGWDLNLTSIELAEGGVNVSGPIDNPETEISGSTILSKDGMYTVKQGIEAGVGAASGSIERQFTAGTTSPNDQVTLKGGYLIGTAEKTLPLSKDAVIKQSSGAHFEVGAGARFLLGIQFSARIGITHD